MSKLRVDKIAAPIVKDEFTGSVFFDGNGDHLDVPLSSDFNFGAGDFTIEAWVYIHTAKDAGVFGTNKSTGSFAGYELDVFTNGSIRFYSGNGSAYNYTSLGASTAAGSVPVQTWTHIVASRQGNTLRLFANGVLSGSNTSFTHTIPDSPTAPDIGSDGISTGSTYHHHGYISNLRVCKGHAVYTENFTVPTRELEVHTKPPKGVVFPAADNVTVLLACQDAYNPLKDSSGRHTITGAGSLGGVPGQELVTNGDFVTDTSGWTSVNSTTSVSSGQLTLTNSGAPNGRLTSTAFDTVVGAIYALKYRTITSGGSYRVEIRESNGVGSEQAFESTTDYSTETFFFTATHTQHTVVIYSIGADGVATIYDYVSVSAVHPVTDANPGLFRRTNITSTITETTGSVYFDGTGDYLDIGKSGDFNFLHNGVTDWSVEFWAYTGTATRQFVWGTAGSSAHTGFYLHIMSQADGQADATGIYAAATKAGSGYISWGADNCLTVNTWHHIAASFNSNTKTLALYVDGREVDNDSGTNSGSFTYSSSDSSYPFTVGKNKHSNGNFINGYISNVRICKGHRVYTSNFIPPTRELEVHPGPEDDRTILLCCYDGENIFADKSGRHIISAYGDRTSSPTPTATDSPIGSTTVTPGLTREVDPTAGPTFQGGVGFTSQNWLTLPKGTTTERMLSFGGVTVDTRGFFAGGYNPTRTDVINYVTVPTLGNAIDFGNLGAPNGGPTGFSDSTRGWIAGGNISPTRTNVMEYVTMASSGNAVDGGDLITATSARPGSVANSIRGVIAGGSTPGQVKTIVHHTIQTTGIVQYFGDLTEVKSGVAGVMSPTRGVFAGGSTPSGRIDTIEHITIASTGNAVLFGELSLDDRSNMGGASNTVRGLFGGGRSPTDYTHIEYITIATLGNGQDFGDLTQSNMDGDIGAVSNSTRVVFGGGFSDELGYVEIATLGNSTQFGQFTVNTTANQDPACFSSGHGGLG